MPRLPHSWFRDRFASIRWMYHLPLLAAACGLLQYGGPALRTDAAPLAARPVLADATDHGDVTQGALRVTRGDQVVECPLRHTDVRADVSGFIARVRVTQTFENPYDETIEAVYVFPLSHSSAVDEMTMVIGERRIAGLVKRRGEARAAYEQAVAQGQTAALLEQERPNIFTQSVGNIPPHQQVRVEIAYVDLLPYEGGRYEFHFPMVVGPRYIPGAAIGHQGTGWAPDTTRVPDASRITPPVLKPGFRNGHDVSLTVAIDAGVPIRALQVHNHEAPVRRSGRSRATVSLPAEDSIPNKDFVLSYFVAGERPETAVLSHAAAGDDGYFLLMVQPREMDQALRASPPRDVCFLIDVSGSMSGQPIAKVSEAMERFFDRMRPQDRLQVVTFAGDATRLFPRYMPATPANVTQALSLTREMRGGGGTEMLQGIRAVLADPVEPERVRIVVMLTDGYIGNEDEIIGEVGRRAGDQMRFWTVGIGASPNRHLLDGVARQGSGASGVLGLDDDPAPLVGSIMDRIQRAQLSRLKLDWGGLDVFETYPARLGELWAGKPVFLLGRYRGEGAAQLTLSGLAEGEPVSFEVPIALASATGADAGAHAVLSAAWARKKIEHLSDQMAVAGESDEMIEEVTGLALQYRLMSAYTSFVAVDESQPPVEGAAPPLRMVVPVPLPDGVSYEGVFGGGREVKEEMDALAYVGSNGPAQPRDERRRRMARADDKVKKAYRLNGPARPSAVGLEGGVAGGVVGGMPGGVVSGVAVAPPPMTPGTLVAPAEMRLPQADVQSKAALVDSRFDAHHQRAQAARAEAARTRKAGDLDAAARALALAALFEQSRQRVTGIDDGTLTAVFAELAEVSAAREEQAARVLPALSKPLGLLLRNTDLASALQQVARAAGIALDVTPGSVEDAAEAFGARAVRLAFLDLRGATGARALTWLAQPAGLTWSVHDGGVRVRSARRAGGSWVYEISRAATDDPRLLALERAVRRAATAADASADVVLLTPDLILVRGSAAAHERASDVLRTGNVASAQDLQQRRAALETRRAKAAVAGWSWSLAAAALDGRVDDRAASELLDAWSVPGVAAADVLTMRALWAVDLARGVRGSDPTVERLWETTRGAAQAAFSAPGAPARLTGEASVYAQLLRSAAPGAAQLPDPDFREASAYAAMARLLSARSADAGAGQSVLAALGSRAVGGDDALVLSALALHHGGGEEWARFREGAAGLARAAGASGAALQVVNRVERARRASGHQADN